MSILDHLNQRILAQKNAQVIANLSPLERVAKAAESIALTEHTILKSGVKGMKKGVRHVVHSLGKNSFGISAHHTVTDPVSGRETVNNLGRVGGEYSYHGAAQEKANALNAGHSVDSSAHADSIPRGKNEEKQHQKDLNSENWHTRTMAQHKDKSSEALRFIQRDAHDAERANPTGHKAGQYLDEMHYAGMELHKRNQLLPQLNK
jgi:hypothetical protein